MSRRRSILVPLLALLALALAASAAAASFPGRNGEVGYARALGDDRMEIYAARPDGTHPRRLTHDGDLKSGPVYSPDGDWIAFTRGYDQIVVMDDDGRHRHRLAVGTNPQWVHGGRAIAFDRIGNPSRRYLIRRDGTHLRLLGRSTFGTYSADGRRVVFSGGSGDNRGLFVMNADGTDRRQLTRSPVYPHNPVDDFPHWRYFDVEPRFSPDGERIVFLRQAGWDAYGYGNVFTIDTDGTHVRALTRPADGQYVSSYTEPTFSPDGRLILFAGHGGVYTVRRDGTGQRLLVG